MKRQLSILVVLTVLVGCASMGLQPAETFNDKLAYAYGTHTAVLQTIDQSVTSGALSSSDAQKLLTQADNARGLLDAAKIASSSGDLVTANNKLGLATAALTLIQSYLNSHPGK